MELSRDTIIEQVNTLLADNTTRQITPERLRTILINIIDSVVFKSEIELDPPSILP